MRTFRIVPYFSVNDKTPNLDGWFELCDHSVENSRKTVPQHRFFVQIKTLNHDYRNTNSQKNQEQQYKYRCDTKVLNTVLTNITLDPVLLFLVDWENERVFWKHLSIEFCFPFMNSSEKENFTLYFSDCDKIDFSTPRPAPPAPAARACFPRCPTGSPGCLCRTGWRDRRY